MVGCKARNNISEQDEALGQLTLTNNQSEIVQYYTNQSLEGITKSVKQRTCYNVSFMGKFQTTQINKLNFVLSQMFNCMCMYVYVYVRVRVCAYVLFNVVIQ